MRKGSWLFVLPLVAALLWVAAPSQATVPNWIVKSVDAVGCADFGWDLTTVFSGLDGSPYDAHTLVTAGGLVYMNQESDFAPTEGADEPWGLGSDMSYGPTTGTYPMPAGLQMKVVFTLERPNGTVLSSWTMVTPSCDSAALLYNGPTVRDRTLTLKARYGPRRVAGRLYAAGFSALYAGRTVTIWKVRPGPDREVGTRTTNAQGRFKARVGKGRYYATSPGYVPPTYGEALADTSRRVRVR